MNTNRGFNTTTLGLAPGESHEAGPAHLFLGAADVGIAVPTASAVQVWEAGRCYPVPGTPLYVIGIASWRGMPLPLIDLGVALGLRVTAARATLDGRRTVVISTPQYLVGLVVEATFGVSGIALELARRPTVVNTGSLAELSLCEVDTPRGAVAVLDVEAFLDRVRVRS